MTQHEGATFMPPRDPSNRASPVDPDGHFHGYDEHGKFVDGAFVIADTEARPKRTRKPSLAAALKQAAKAGAAVSGATLNSDVSACP
jgi:hypothetical protein